MNPNSDQNKKKNTHSSVDSALVKSEVDLSKLIEQSPVAMILLMGPEFRIELINDMALSAFGRNEKNVRNTPILVAFPEIKEQGFAEILQNVYESGIPFKSGEMTSNLIKDNVPAKICISFTFQPYKDTSDKVAGIICIGADITDQIETRRQIAQHAAKYKSVFEKMNQGYCIIEVIFDDNNIAVDYRFLEVNKTFENQSGLKNAAGRLVRDLIPDLEKRWFEAYGKVALTGESIRFTEGSDAMGRWFDVEAYALGDSEDHKVALLFTDITENKIAEINLRESEHRFRDLADQSPLIIFIIEPNAVATISYWNKGWLDYTGQTYKEAIGRAWDGIVHPDDVPTVLEIYVPAFRDRNPYYIPAIRLKRHDGVYRWHMFKANPRLLPNGNFIGYVGVGFDIHEQQIADEEQRQFSQKLEALVEYRTQELERSNEDLQQFAHVASHDLKEPVRKIRTFGGMLQNDFGHLLPEKATGFINKMMSATERLNAMIEGVLAYSSANASEQKIDQVNLNEVVKDVQNDLEILINNKKAKIIAGRLPVIEGATVLLYQLFYNLINNAIKFSRKTEPAVVSINADDYSEDGNSYTKITVKDNGIGFDEGSAEKIFETFSRLNSKDAFEGTGLGLSLCKKIVLRHSGSITAKSNLNEGATFTIMLPVKQAKQSI